MGKVLVTGGAGFIGSHVVDELIKSGKKVIVLDDLSNGLVKNVNPKAKFIKGSITNVHLINRIFEENIDYVFHLAAYAAEGLSHFIRRFNYNNNLIGSINLINASVNHNVKCFVFTSSIAVYGSNKAPMNEDMIPMPEDPYGISKLAVEQDLKAAKNMFGLNYIIFRPHNVYGEKQNTLDKYRNVVGILINQACQNKELTIFGDGNQKRAFTYISDVAPLISKSIGIKKAYNKIFNLGSDKVYTINELAGIIKKYTNSKQKIRYLPKRKEVFYAYASHNLAKRFLGNHSRVGLEEGIKRTVEWFKKTKPEKMKQLSKRLEVNKNIPSLWLEK